MTYDNIDGSFSYQPRPTRRQRRPENEYLDGFGTSNLNSGYVVEDGDKIRLGGLDRTWSSDDIEEDYDNEAVTFPLTKEQRRQPKKYNNADEAKASTLVSMCTKAANGDEDVAGELVVWALTNRDKFPTYKILLQQAQRIAEEMRLGTAEAVRVSNARTKRSKTDDRPRATSTEFAKATVARQHLEAACWGFDDDGLPILDSETQAAFDRLTEKQRQVLTGTLRGDRQESKAVNRALEALSDSLTICPNDEDAIFTNLC